MSSSKVPPGRNALDDTKARALLLRHNCPTPWHALRTLFLGYIASPELNVSPLAALTQAWGGALPVFSSSEEVEEVMQVIVAGLWNRLSEHQSTRKPFRLTRGEVSVTGQGLHGLALLRAQELKGFVDGLFGSKDKMLLPQKAHEAVVALAELHTMFDAAARFMAGAAAPAPVQDLKDLLRNLQQMSVVADEHINRAVQSCKRARSQHPEPMATEMSHRILGDGSDNREAQGMADPEDDEPDFVESPLSQSVTRNGVTVRVEIYGDSNGRWILEVVDAENASHVWEHHFETDQQALDEALRALEEEPLEFLGRPAGQSMN